VLTRFPRIRERIDNQASTMSGGEQKQLEVGRALLLRPRVLLIDEPSIGLSPKLVQDVMALLRQLADAGTTVLMVEQNVRTALKFANRALVLEMGASRSTGPRASCSATRTSTGCSSAVMPR
jgi:branched-chain amino acid transport system ATP-binding protein